jgi:hypothetical protein
MQSDAATHMCGPLAAGSFCMTGAVQVCDEKADCALGEVCCMQFSPAGVLATCRPTCVGGAVRYQACKTDEECENRGPCTQHTCPAGDTVRTCSKPLECQ